MRVRAKKVAPAHKGQTQKQPAMTYNFPAPVRGWVRNVNLAVAGDSSARVLDNWICTTSGIRARAGSVKVATLPNGATSAFSYNGASNYLFFADGVGIYDATSPADPDIALTATVSGQTDGEYSTEQFGTAGGRFLYALNDADEPQLFDGTSWQAVNNASAPISITGVTTSGLSHVWSHASRLWFIEKDTTSAWYLPVDSIGGAATEFSLAGVFSKGGSLLFGATWSLDAGDGLDDKCVFVTSEGEVAIYSGTNPGSATDWSIQGVYSMPKPISKKSYISAGGDLLIATEIGLIPISAAINTDLGAIETKAVSAPIAPYWLEQSQSLTSKGWEIEKLTSEGIMIVSQPDTASGTEYCLCVNLITGAWSRFSGWDVQCMTRFNGRGYYGDASGVVYLMNAGGSDNGSIYVASYIGQHEDLGHYGQTKSIRQMRPAFRVGTPINPQISANSNFSETLPTPPSSVGNYGSDEWDVGEWDVSVWDAGTSYENITQWNAVSATGEFIAPVLQISFGVPGTPYVELTSIDAQFHVGAVVT